MAEQAPDVIVTQLDLLRHGQCEGGDIFRGHYDVRLTARGLVQMQHASTACGTQWDRIISSPLQRCWQFAQGLVPVDIPVFTDARLRELSFGDWDGKKISDIWQTDHPTISAWSCNPLTTTPPNGEPLADVDLRVAEFLDACVDEHRGEKILLVTHGGIIRVILTRLLGMPLAHANRWHVPYACLSRVVVYHDPQEQEAMRYQLVAHNFIAAAS